MAFVALAILTYGILSDDVVVVVFAVVVMIARTT